MTPFPVYINGRYVGTLYNGKTVTAEVLRANIYFIDSKLSEENALVYDNKQSEYGIDLKPSAGAFAYYIKRDSDFVKLPSVDFGKLFTGSFGEPKKSLSSSERALALCFEFWLDLCDDIQEVLASENLFSMPDALQTVGATGYSKQLRKIIENDFSDVPLPLGDETIDKIQKRIERTNSDIQKNKSAYDEFYNAFVSYMLKEFDDLGFLQCDKKA